MVKGTLLYAQSGGVTAVINATASAVITEARARGTRVLAARNTAEGPGVVVADIHLGALAPAVPIEDRFWIPELPWATLRRIADRILAEVPGVCRVLYDLSPKGPATIEWE